MICIMMMICVLLHYRAREFEREREEGRDLAAVAREMSETVSDPHIKASQVRRTAH